MPETWLSDTRASYDTDAPGYAEKVAGWLRDAGFTIDATLIIRPVDTMPGAVIHAHSTQSVSH